MSLTNGTFNPVASDGADEFYTQSAWLDMDPAAELFQDNQDVNVGFQEAGQAVDIDIMDVMLDRISPKSRYDPVEVNNGAGRQHANGPQQDPGQRLSAAWQNAQDHMRDLPKLQAGKMTTAQEPGARQIDQDIGGKQEATQGLRAALEDYKLVDPDVAAAPQGPEGGPGLGHLRNGGTFETHQVDFTDQVFYR